MTLRELADRLGCRLEGDGALVVSRLAAIDTAGPGDLTFLANPKYAAAVATTRATAIILDERAAAAPCAMLRTSEPYVMFARALTLLHAPPRPPAGVHPSAVVEPGAEIHPEAWIGPLVVVGAGARIGARTLVHPLAAIGPGSQVGTDCVIHSHASLREHVRLGDRVVLQNGAVIGSDGFGFATGADGRHEKIPQLGSVVIEDDVEIGANSAVDRPPMGVTRIARGTKIDNLVQVAHGVQVGEDVFLAAQVGIAGSTVVEDKVMLGGQVGVAGHIRLGRGAKATAQTGIPNSVEPGRLVSGYPAIDNRDWLKASAVFKKLPELRRALHDLEQRLARLEPAPAAAPAGTAGTTAEGRDG
jgi:UDP-3-O-[3-hydroxymyristoyl] glucosamine N-acyltransferase